MILKRRSSLGLLVLLCGRRVAILLIGVALSGAAAADVPGQPSQNHALRSAAVGRPEPGLSAAAAQAQLLVRAGKKEDALRVSRSLAAEFLDDDHVASLSAASLARLGDAFVAAGDTESSLQLARQWHRRIMAEKGFHGSMRPRHYAALTSLLKNHGMEEQRRQLAKVFEEQAAADQSQGVRGEDAAELYRAAVAVGSDPVRKLAWDCIIASVRKGDQFRMNLLPSRLEELAELSRLEGDATISRQLAEFIPAGYLMEPGLADAIAPDEWAVLLQIVAVDGSQSAKKAILSIFGQRLSQGLLQLDALSLPECLELVKTSDQMGGDEALRGLVVASWLGLSGRWSGLADKTRHELIAAVGGDQVAWDSLIGQLPSADLHESAPGEYAARVAARTRLGGSKGFEVWRDDAAGRLLATQSPSAELLVTAGRLLAARPMELSAEQAMSLIEKLAAQAGLSAELSESTYAGLARSLEAHVGLLKVGVQDASGRVRLPVAKVLTHVMKSQNNGNYWYQELTRRKDALSGDALASLELARAYAIGFTSFARKNGFLVFAGNALAAAETDDMRLRCLEEMVVLGKAAEAQDQVAQVFASVEGQFQGPQKEQVAALRQALGQTPDKAVRQWREDFNLRRQMQMLRTQGEEGL